MLQRTLAAAALALVACSSDPVPTPDAANDLGPVDVATDAPPDVAPDASTDAATDRGADAVDVADGADVVGDVRTDATPDSGVSPVRTWCERFAQALCQRQVFCRFSAEMSTPCILRETARCAALNAGVERELRAGRIAYDDDAATDCLSSLPERYCLTRDLANASPRCRDVFRGTVAVGGTCQPGVPGVCANGYCPATMACASTCRALATEGAACDDARVTAGPCAAGLVCVTGTCRRALTAGTACDPMASACGTGIVCLRDGSAATCVAPRPSGSPCTADGQCLNGLCANGFCAGGLAMGDRCSGAYQCPDGLACVDTDPGAATDLRCAMGSPADTPCTDTTCAVTLTCSGGSRGACIPVFPTMGQHCTTGCVAGLWCQYSASGSFGTCLARAAAGAACVAGVGSCVDGYRCMAGRCEPLLTDGATCATADECASGTCTSGRCAPVCTP